MFTSKSQFPAFVPALVFYLVATPLAAASQGIPGRDTTVTDSTSHPAQTLEAVRIQARKAASPYAADYSRTATKIPSLPRDIPQSMTTVTKALVRDQAMRGMADVVRYIPGITMGQGEGNRDQPTIRGNGSTADFFVDGVRDDAQYFRDLYNLESVEALKGSNAMTFGRGGGGGVLNRVTKEAQGATSREIRAEGGSFGERRVSTDLQQRMSALFSARLNSVYEGSESYRDEVSLDRSGINPTIAVTSAGLATRITAGYEYFRDRRTADRGIPSLLGKPVDTDPSTFFGSPDESVSRMEVNAANATISHDAGKFQVRNHATFSDYDKFYQNVYPSGASGGEATLSAYKHAIGRRNFFNQTDITLNGKTGYVTHDFVVGAEVGFQKTKSYRETGYFAEGSTSARVPLEDPTYRGDIDFRQSATDADNSTDVFTRSVYVLDQLTLAPEVRLIAGLRYERFGLRFDDDRSDARRKRDDGMFSPRLGLVIKPAETASLYASYSRSFLPGSGDQFTSLTDITRALEPERFTNYEVGAKWDVMDRVALTIAAYRLDRTNTRATNPSDPSRFIQSGAQRSEGVELGASGSITGKWDVAAGAALQRAEIVSATVASPAGATVALIPSRSMSIWNKYAFSSRFAAGLGAIHQSKMFAAIDNNVTLPSFTRFDAAIYAGIIPGIRAQMNIENIFDVKYFPSSNGNNNIAPGSPREVRLSLAAAF
jgi:catecholate siderophore receptor